MSLLASLPAPKRDVLPVAQATVPISTTIVAIGAREPPPYLRRQGFIPRRPDDFGDGGAFPEVHVAQYPLDMGRPDGTKSNKTLAVTINADGELNYDAIVRQGANKDKIIASSHKALVPKVDRLNEIAERPDQETVDETARATMEALQKVVDKKIAVAQPKSLPAQPGAAQYIKYTPSQQGPQYASGAKQRIIKLQDMPVDPMEPPKFRHTKVPRGTGSPPVPVMHSPPRQVTVKDQQDWKVPPCVSNWKNAKGYTVPLDKRLAADGRGLNEVVISDKFAQLSEALYVAEGKAREAVDMRQKIQKELLAKEKAKKEAELRELAMRARMERAGGIAERAEGGVPAYPGPPPTPGGVGGAAAAHAAGDAYQETREERAERQRRDEIREERRRERERERRLESRDAHGSKKSKLTRDYDRDVSEKVALGMPAVTAAGGEVMYDQRLFNQEQGLAQGLANEDSYNIYDKALFADRGNANLFRPNKAADEEQYGGAAGGDGGVRTDKFKADKGFRGADESVGPRTSGVEFEREEADPFGLDQFLTEVNRGKKRATDGIGHSGQMKAAAGGSSLDDHGGGGGGRRMQFTAGSGRN